MRRLATCALALAAGLGLGSAAFMSAGAQTGDGWVTLLDSSKMGEWDRVGESNWRMEDGAAGRRQAQGDGPAYLVTKGPYKDFDDPCRVLGERRRQQRHLSFAARTPSRSATVPATR